MLLDEQTHRAVASKRFQQRNEFPIWNFTFSLLLSFIIFFLSASTNSLLLFSLGLLQIGNILVRLRRLTSQDQTPYSPWMNWRMVAVLFSAFAIILSAGHLFVETYWRFSEPIPIPALTAFWGALAVFSGHHILERWFQKAGGQSVLVWGRLSEKQLLQGVFVLSLFAFLTIYWTKLFWIDALLGVLFSLPIFLGAVFASLDAYWRLEEQP